jgi:hypothetical protein
VQQAGAQPPLSTVLPINAGPQMPPLTLPATPTTPAAPQVQAAPAPATALPAGRPLPPAPGAERR